MGRGRGRGRGRGGEAGPDMGGYEGLHATWGHRVHVPHFAMTEVTGNELKHPVGAVSREPRRGPMRGKRTRGGKLFELVQPSMAQFLLNCASDTTSYERDPSGRDLSIALLLERSKEAERSKHAELGESRLSEDFYVAPPTRSDRLEGDRFFGEFLPAMAAGDNSPDEPGPHDQKNEEQRPPPSSQPQAGGCPDNIDQEAEPKSPSTAAGDAPILSAEIPTSSPLRSTLKGASSSRPASSSLAAVQFKKWGSGPGTNMQRSFAGSGTWALQGCSSSIVNKRPNGQTVMASNSVVQAHTGATGQLPPLFWLGDVMGSQDITQPTPSLPTQFAIAQPSFDDLKEETAELRKKDVEGELARGEGAAEIDSFDSEVFAWTQHPCSPELDANLKNVQGNKSEDTSPSRAHGSIKSRLTFLDQEDEPLSKVVETGNGNADAHEGLTSAVLVEQGHEVDKTLQDQEQEREHVQENVQKHLQEHGQNQGELCGQEQEQFRPVRKGESVCHEAEPSGCSDKVAGQPEIRPPDPSGLPGGVAKPKAARQQKKVQWDRLQDRPLVAEPPEVEEMQQTNVNGASTVGMHKPTKKRSGVHTETACGTVLDIPNPAKRRKCGNGEADSSASGMDIEENPRAQKSVALKRSKIRRIVDSVSAQPVVNSGTPADGRSEYDAHGTNLGTSHEAIFVERSLGDVINDRNLVDDEVPRRDFVGFNNHIEGEGPGKKLCAFCGQEGDSQVAGELLQHVDKSPAARSALKVSPSIHVHKKCADWAPAVYFDHDQIMNLEAELNRALKIKCSICNVRGAALGCYNGHCRKSFHYPCAMSIPGCKWEDDIFVLRCPAHATWKLGEERKTKSIRRKSKSSVISPSSVRKDQQDEPAQQAPLPSKRPLKPRSRDSGEAAEQPSPAIPSLRWPSGQATKWVLTGSGLDAAEKEQLAAFVAISGASSSKAWNSTVTHVIAGVDESGSARRTLKFLMATLEGKWILKSSWMSACTGAGEPVPEEAFEVTSDTHGMVDGPKRGRELAAMRAPKILHGFAIYFCLGFESAYKTDLLSLILAAGGRVLHRKPAPSAQVQKEDAPRRSRTLVLYNSDVSAAGSLEERQRIIRDRQQAAKAVACRAGATALPHTWLLDSVAGCRLQPI